VSLLLMIFFGKITRVVPSTIVGIIAGTLLAYFFTRQGISISTIGNRFSYESAGVLQHGIPPYPPVFHLLNLPSYAEFKTLLAPSMVIAALGALESLLSATVADSMAGTRHNPNAELNGIGISNILSGMASGIPATGAIARTATNIHAGAKTPIAAVIHSALIMGYVLLLAPLISYVPMAALSALLLITAWRMSHARQFIRILKIAPRSDSIVLLTCFGLTVFVDMVAGVSVGIVLASFLFMKRISEMTQVDLSLLSNGMENRDQHLLPDNVMVFRIDGPLFFGTVEKAYDRYNFIHDYVSCLIIDMEHVPLIDMTGLVAMKSMLTAIAREGREVILCGTHDITDKIMLKIAGPLTAHVKTAASVKQALSSLEY
jgi:SulP family sulfate permease